MVSVARKLKMMKEQHQGQSCLFWWGDCRIKGHNHEKIVLDSSPSEDIFCTLETNDGRRT
jgi:hypothetical protein